MTLSSQQPQILIRLSKLLEKLLRSHGLERPAQTLIAQAQWLAANSRDAKATSPHTWLDKAVNDVVLFDRLDGMATAFVHPVDGPLADWLATMKEGVTK